MTQHVRRKRALLGVLFCLILSGAAEAQSPAAAVPPAAAPAVPVAAPAAPAAPSADICPPVPDPKAAAVCLNQPVQGKETSISGRAPKGTVDITVGTVVYPRIKVKKGKFELDNLDLAPEDKISVSLPDRTMIHASVLPGVCDSPPIAPCLAQPHVGDAKVTVEAVKDSKNVLVFVVGKNLTRTVSTGAIAAGTFNVTVPQLGPADRVELEANGHVVAGPVSVVPFASQGDENTTSSCSADSAPCISPITASPAGSAGTISGFVKPGAGGAPAATANLYVANAQVSLQIDKTTGSFTAQAYNLTANEPVALTQNGQTTTATVAAAPSTPGTSSSLYTLGLVGVNVTSTSVSGPQMQYFVSFDTMAPVPFLGRGACPRGRPDYPLAQKCWLWFNPRISSAPATASSALNSFSSPSSLSSGIGGQTVGQITQTFDFQTGFEYALNQPWWGRQFGWGTSWARSTISLILGGGASTPLSSLNNASEFALNNNLGAQFTGNPGLAKIYPELAQALCNGYGFTSTPPCTPSSTAYTDVAFVLPNRSRFYRDYFGGFRLRTYYFTGACKDAIEEKSPETALCKVVNTYPGTFDVRLGEDETVTAGHLRGVVLTLAGSYPLPGTSGTVRIFGAEYLRLHKNQNTTALVLLPPATSLPITNSAVVIQPIAASDQDYYQLGIGVDLIPLISKWFTNSNSSSSSGASASSSSQ